MILTLTLLLACGPQAGGYNGGGQSNGEGTWSDGGGGGGGGGVVDGTCDDANEQCGPGSCRGSEGGTMLPGSDCLSCHSPGRMDDDESLTVGGTVYVDHLGSDATQGAIVRVIDSEGRMVEMTSNRTGNFYSGRSLRPPLVAEVEVDGRVIPMASEVSTGACNSCHACDGTTGKIYAR
ncbi:MAG: hypothetical protein H6741_12725 [Alphaproteobacteria bacterium]|nr:hypothetical protein [Alphaproteobacteria bacterium]